jgi:hypothetical protein
MAQSHQQRAFALAHRAAENDAIDPAARNVFREIAYQLWLSAGGTADLADMPIFCHLCGKEINRHSAYVLDGARPQHLTCPSSWRQS